MNTITSFVYGKATVNVHNHIIYYVGVKQYHEVLITIDGAFAQMYLKNEILDLTAQALGINVFVRRPYNRNAIINGERIDGKRNFTLKWSNRI